MGEGRSHRGQARWGRVGGEDSTRVMARALRQATDEAQTRACPRLEVDRGSSLIQRLRPLLGKRTEARLLRHIVDVDGGGVGLARRNIFYDVRGLDARIAVQDVLMDGAVDVGELGGRGRGEGTRRREGGVDARHEAGVHRRRRGRHR